MTEPEENDWFFDMFDYEYDEDEVEVDCNA